MSSPYQAKEFAVRWAQMSLCEQMGNIGSEVSRALNWKAKNNSDYSLKSFERALELIDITLACTADHQRAKEIARVREALVDFVVGDNKYGSSDILWRKYFDAFAMAARKNR